MDEADALEALSNVLERITENPYDISAHAEHIRLAQAAGLDEQLESALDMFTAFWAAGEPVWLPVIDRKLKTANLDSVADVRGVLELFARAEQDYTSIPILQRHVEFLVERWEHFQEEGTRPSEFEELFTPEWMGETMAQVATRGAGHLTKGHLVWDPWRDWELEQLQNAGSGERATLVSHVEKLLLDRLQQPHSNHEETFQAYSSFTTNYKPPDEYEVLLVQASKMRAQAVKAFNRRESMELSLAQAGNSLEGYAYYIGSERRAKVPDAVILRPLYERAIAEADFRRYASEAGAEEALRGFWTDYVDFLRLQDVDDEDLLMIYKRGLRSVPVSGELVARYFRFLERGLEVEDAATEITAVYENTQTIAPLQRDADQLVAVVLARAGFEKRRIEAGTSAGGYDTLLHLLTDGISRVRQASRAGDARLRLEKYFSALCLDVEELSGNAIILWEDTVKHYKTSYLAWTSYADVLQRQHMHDEARKVFNDVAGKPHLDWPEAAWEAWISFEQLYGSPTQIDDALDRVRRAQNQVNARRTKEAERAQAQLAAESLITETQAATGASVAATPQAVPTPMDVDSVAEVGTRTEGHSKRKADDESAPEGHKKARFEEPPAKLKRDRENCTVFVAELPVGIEEDELRTLFKDCGSIREVKVTQLPNSLVATVEFMERESVPMALTKDKKRVRGKEIAVHLGWCSTLYITNFPEDADDTFIRTLFAKYGTIFDVRWPSKKFKSTRRFCYLQYTSPSSAESALELNGTEIDDSHRISVFISNPERKKERTDSDANDREVYVAGISKLTTKEDLETLFKTYGAVKEVRMILDKDQRSKGFAFIEFENEKDALAALAANNHTLKNRRMAVTLADTRFRPKNRTPQTLVEERDRSVRVRGLPKGTQEGLLQQVLEKHASVKRVEVFADLNEAVVELESGAEAGKLLLQPDAIVFNGNKLQIVAESSSKSRPMAPPPATSGMFVPRAAKSRPRAGLGSKQRGSANAAAPAASGASGSGGTAAGGAKGQDDFRKMLLGGK